VIKLLDSHGIAASEAFKAEAISACRTPKSKENDGNIFDGNIDVSNDVTQLNFADRVPR
jgi:hypothetical protein